MLLKADTLTRQVLEGAGPGTRLAWRPIIMAKYRARRSWYVLESKFRDTAHRNSRLAQLLELPKRVLRIV